MGLRNVVRCRWLRGHGRDGYRGIQHESLPRHGTHHALPGIAQCAPDLDDALRQRALGDDGRTPDRVQQFLLADARLERVERLGRCGTEDRRQVAEFDEGHDAIPPPGARLAAVCHSSV